MDVFTSGARRWKLWPADRKFNSKKVILQFHRERGKQSGLFPIGGNNGTPNTGLLSRRKAKQSWNSRQRLWRIRVEGIRRRKGYLHMNTGRSLSLREWSHGDILVRQRLDEGAARYRTYVPWGRENERNRSRLLARDIRIPAYFSRACYNGLLYGGATPTNYSLVIKSLLKRRQEFSPGRKLFLKRSR